MKKILIIEDEDMVREGIAELLAAEDYIVYTAENGNKGVLLAQQHIPDLIICDINMPVLNGYQTLELLQEDISTAAIPFIFLTGKSAMDDLRDGMDLGADDYLTKPFKANELFKAVDIRLKKKDIFEKQYEKKYDDLKIRISSVLPQELRRPLNAILTSSQLLVENRETMTDKEINEIQENLHQSASRLDTMISNYLLYVELELISLDSKRKQILRKYSEFDSTGLGAETIVNNLEEKYQRFGDVSNRIDNYLIFMVKDHFLKMLEEVIDNAFKYSEPGSNIEIYSGLLAGKYIITIKDSGRGMTEEQFSEIQAFYHFDRNVQEQQGSGLGLAIVQRLAELYGIEIKISSELNKYTEISFIFPEELKL